MMRPSRSSTVRPKLIAPRAIIKTSGTCRDIRGPSEAIRTPAASNALFSSQNSIRIGELVSAPHLD